MFVKDRMTAQPLVVITPEAPITEAQRLMQEHSVRHLPVVEDHDRLVGLLTRETVIKAIPWSAASLSALETRYILSKIRVGKVMLRDFVTTTEDVPVEEAARVMVDHKLTCLPVLRQTRLVGIITDIDLLSITAEMLGARRAGVRLSVLVHDQPGEMARLSAAIAGVGGNLAAFGSWKGQLPPDRLGIVLKVDRISKEKLLSALECLEDVEILDVRIAG
ncbi:MAG: CBS domain-containing protein [Anaerolineae bacterium]